MRCPKCRKATVIKIATEPRLVNRCVSCGCTYGPIIMTPDFFQTWNQKYINEGKRLRDDTETMVMTAVERELAKKD